MDATQNGAAAGGLEIRARADPAELSSMRHRVREFVQHSGGSADLASDLELVVSELATNVIEHTSSPTVTVVLSKTPSDWLIDVADVGDLSILDDVALPDMSQPTGRGLFVVTSIVDEIRIVDHGASYAIRCRLGA